MHSMSRDHHDRGGHDWHPTHGILLWEIRKDLEETQIHDIIHLLDAAHLQNLSMRRKSKKWPKNLVNINFRYHFYRQTAYNILGWSEH